MPGQSSTTASTGVLLSPEMPLARRATWPENLLAVQIFNWPDIFQYGGRLGCECTDVLSPPSLSPIYSKWTGSYKKKNLENILFLETLQSYQIQMESASVSESWVHIHSFKSVIVQFHHTSLNVRLYLNIRVEIRLIFSIKVPTSETKRSDIISVSSLWIWRNLHAWIWIMGFCRTKHEQPA